jgi:UDP-N-acetylmuramate: L-alanyl-gamma-D-glutamyl-meso-diaminopimelate ligase
MERPDTAIVYFNPESIKHKRLESISKEQVRNAFNRYDLLVFTESKKLEKYLKLIKWKNQNLLMMSSGNFNGIKFNTIINDNIEQEK